MSEIRIENVGPIEALTIPIPEAGGVVVLHGRNGSGKSTALKATQALLQGKGSLVARDGARSGSIELGAARITVGKNTRRSGELETVHLEDRLSIADLVDPGLKDPEAADRRRVRALVGLAAGEGWFEGLKTGMGDAALSIDWNVIDRTDPVLAAQQVKDQLHETARRSEAESQAAAAKAAALEESFPDEMLGEVDDDATLRDRFAEASRRHAELLERARASEAGWAAAVSARAALERARAEYDGPDSQTALEMRDDAKVDLYAATKALGEAEERHSEAKTELQQFELILKTAQIHEANLAAWAATINATHPAAPDPNELAQAEAVAVLAQKACETAALQRKAVDARDQAAQLRVVAMVAGDRAKARRDEAARVDTALASLVACPELAVASGRLVTETARGATPFSELSEGERWAMSLRIAAGRVGEHGLIVVPQEAWEGLDAFNRAAIDTLARELCVVVLTAEAYRPGETPEKVVV